MDAPLLRRTHQETGGWKTFPFIIGAIMGVAMVTYGVTSNLEVYLIKGFNIGRIDAAQICGIAGGCISLAPIVGGIFADSVLGCSTVLGGATAACLASMLFFTLTAIMPTLRPPPCFSTTSCQPPTTIQLAFLFFAIALLAVGVAGTRYNGITMGANQLSTEAERDTFFNWSIVALYISSIVGATILVYVQDSVSWQWGFWLCVAIAALALFLYLCGRPYFLDSKPNNNNNNSVIFSRFRSEGKLLISLLPITSSGILLCATICVQTSITVLQALAMDRHLDRHLVVPAGSINVLVLATAASSLVVLDRTRCRLQPPLRRIAIGHVVNALAMAAMAFTESRRLAVATAKPLSVFWLVPPLVLIGFGEAFHFPGTVALYYHEFPASLRSTATGTYAVVSGLGYYMSSAIIAAFRWGTDWLKEDVNQSRLDNVYWTLAFAGLLNFAYFLLCARLYKREEKPDLENHQI